MVKDEAWAMVLRLLVQILIKVHAGPNWGMSHADVQVMTAEAENLAKAMERGGW